MYPAERNIYRTEIRMLPSGMFIEKVVLNNRIVRYSLACKPDPHSKMTFRITKDEYDALYPISQDLSEETEVQ
mgnify:CR=1 FL=1